jgi:TP901 family phage tail tape measure protein
VAEKKLMVVVAGRTSEFEKAMKKAQSTMRTTSRELTSTGKSLTKAVTLPIVAIGAASLKASIDFESAFAGVRKTVDASEEQFAQLSAGIRDMSKEIPVAATEIAKVAESAGQLGISVPNILGFTRVMSDLGVASNMSADQAATSLARLANITQMPQTEFDRLGSTVVALGNNLATTESEIVDMSLRLASAGKQVGMTEAQTLSLAGALSSVGVEAQAGGSAFSKVMVQMQLAVEKGGDSLQDFAGVAGMTSADFQKAFRDDAASALIAFIRGLETAEERGVSAIRVLDDMGISEVRMRDALLRAAGAGDLFAESIQLGTQAWQENVALTKEAEERYKTTESRLVILKNRMVDQAITLGDALAPAFIDALDAAEPFFLAIEMAAGWFADLDASTQRTIIGIAGVAAATGPALVIGGKMLDMVRGTRKAYDALTKAMAAKKAATIAMTTATGTATVATTAATTATKAYASSLTLLMGPVGIAAAAFAAIATVIGVSYMNSLAAAKKRTEELATQMRTAADEEHRIKTEALDEQERLEREAYAKRRSLIEEEHRVRVEAAEKAYQAEKDRISARLSELDKEHDAAIQAIRDEYGVVERTTESKTDLARKASQAVIDSLDAEAQKAKEVHDERIRQLDEEYQGKLRLLDEETREQLEALQAEIDGIDAKTRLEDKLERERKDQQRVLDLQARIAQETDAERRVSLEQDLADLLSDINRRQVLEQREIQKTALREQMDEVRRAAEERKAQLEEEHKQAKLAEQEALKTKLENIEDLQKAEAAALEERIAAIQEERIAKEIAENAKYEASKLSLEGALEALEVSYEIKKTKLAEELGDAIAHEDAKLRIYEQGLADQRAALAEHLEETQRMIEEAAAEQVRAEQQARADMERARGDYYRQQGTLDGDIAPDPLGQPGNNAFGTDFWRGGWTWVGEKGPELARLPRGTKILSNRESMKLGQEGSRPAKSAPSVATVPAGSPTASSLGREATFTIDVHDNVFQDGTDAGNRIAAAIRRAGVR